MSIVHAYYCHFHHSFQLARAYCNSAIFIRLQSRVLLVRQLWIVNYYQGCTKGQKSGGAGSNAGRRRSAAAARRRLLICQNLVGQLPHQPHPLVHPCIVAKILEWFDKRDMVIGAILTK